MGMQVLNEAYSNFVNSINSDQTRRVYEHSLSQFLKHNEMDLDSFLSFSQQEISNLIINYLVEKKISRQYKVVIFSAIKHACEMNDVILNWKKLKKFIKFERTDNCINGRDRGYTVKEILKILDFADFEYIRRLNPDEKMITDLTRLVGQLVVSVIITEIILGDNLEFTPEAFDMYSMAKKKYDDGNHKHELVIIESWLDRLNSL